MKQPTRKQDRKPRELLPDELSRASGGYLNDPHGHFAQSQPDGGYLNDPHGHFAQ